MSDHKHGSKKRTPTAFGIDIGGSGIKGAVVDVLTGQLVGDRLRVPTPRPSVPREVVAVIGGLGSLKGAALGALMVGLVRSAAVHFLPQVELFSIYLVMVLVLLFRPKGLFSSAEARKI